MASPPPRRHRAFSLSELLIVIAVISALLILGSAGIQKSRNIAQITTCLQNMRSYGLSILAYTGDHSQAFISPGYQSGDNSKLWNYTLHLQGYLTFPQQRTLYCPVLKTSTRVVSGKTEAQRVSEGYVNAVGYAYNYWLPGKRLSHLAFPSQTMLLSETAMDLSIVMGTSPEDRFVRRHNSSRNVLFCDGHGESWSNEHPQPHFKDTFWAYPPTPQ